MIDIIYKYYKKYSLLFRWRVFRPLGGQGQSDCVQTSVRRCWDTTACTHQAQHGVIKCSDRESYLAHFAFSFTFMCSAYCSFS